jgi:hypothetical protein
VIPILDITSPTYEEDFENNYEIALTKTQNGVLVQLLLLGQYLCRNNVPINNYSRFHVVAAFLFDYFGTEPEALAYLSDVTFANIYSVPAVDRATIRQQRPEHPPPAPSPDPDYHSPSTEPPQYSPSPSPPYFDVLGQNTNSPGEMWPAGPNSPFLLPESTPFQYSPSPVEPDDFYQPPWSPIRDQSPEPSASRPKRRLVTRDLQQPLKRSRTSYELE